MHPAIESWREQILKFDREREAMRGGGHGHGHGRPVYASRPMDPYRTDDPVVNGLFEFVGEDTEVLDVGGGAGRLALPLATRARHVTVVDPSEDSVELLKSRMEEAGLTNITVINEGWEDADVPPADLVLCSLVLHHQLEAVSFVRRMQEHTRDRVVVLEMMETPGAVDRPFHQRVRGSVPTPLPGLPKLLALLWAMEIFPDVSMLSPVTPILDTDPGLVAEYMRRRLSVEEGTEEDERLQAAMEELLEETPEGITIRGVSPHRPGMVTWQPGGAGGS